MAEAIARQSFTEVIEASSAGLHPLGMIVGMTRRTLECNGYSADGLRSKALAPEMLAEADLVINMSGYSREEGFPRCESVEDWTIEDPFGADPGLYQRIFEEIEQRVSELAERLRGEVQAAKPDREG